MPHASQAHLVTDQLMPIQAAASATRLFENEAGALAGLRHAGLAAAGGTSCSIEISNASEVSCKGNSEYYSLAQSCDLILDTEQILTRILLRRWQVNAAWCICNSEYKMFSLLRFHLYLFKANIADCNNRRT